MSTDLLDRLPAELRERAYRPAHEYAWRREDARRVVELASERGWAVCGIEIWLARADAPEIPEPFIYTWTAPDREESERWRDFQLRANKDAASYIEIFDWDPRDARYAGREPLFNLDVMNP